MKLHRHFGIVAAIVFSVFFAARALAHPHVWVTIETEIELGENKDIVGFRHKWTFDEGYTSFAIEGLDTNGDGTYSEEELQPLAKTNIEALKEFDYFTFPFIGEKKAALKEPADYRLEYKDKLLTLYFTVPLSAPVPFENIKDFSLAIYDPEMYVALTFADKTPVKIASLKPVACTAHTEDGAAEPRKLSTSRLAEITEPSGGVGLRFAQRITITCPS